MRVQVGDITMLETCNRTGRPMVPISYSNRDLRDQNLFVMEGRCMNARLLVDTPRCYQYHFEVHRKDRERERERERWMYMYIEKMYICTASGICHSYQASTVGG